MTESKTQYHHGDLASAIMDAAIKRIAQEGVDKLSLRAVARDLGVSQTAPYRHFTDKTHLLNLLAQKGFELLANASQEAADACQGNTLSAIAAVGMAYIRFAQAHPEQYRLMFGGTVKLPCAEEDLMNTRLTSFDVILEQVSKGVEQGDLIHQDPRLIARSCWAMVHGVSMLLIDGFYDEHTDEEQEKLIADMLKVTLSGISAKPIPE